MAVTATYYGTTVLQGVGISAQQGPYMQDTQTTAPTNFNAPPPEHFNLTAASYTYIIVPAGFTISRAQLMPPNGSTNAKTIYGVTSMTPDATGFSNWTTGSITIPVSPGQTIAIYSPAAESIAVAYS